MYKRDGVFDDEDDIYKKKHGEMQEMPSARSLVCLASASVDIVMVGLGD